jgi:glycosyltransferase involved in cell wall biosynthesis
MTRPAKSVDQTQESPSGSSTRPTIRRVLVCMPTYNECESLPETARRLRAAVPTADLLIIDDASPDGTGELADKLAAEDASVHVLHREAKTGLGAAYIAGFGWGRKRDYDVLVEMDADGSHQPEELHRLLAALEDADVVLGSRWVPGGRVENWPASRLWLSRGGNAYVRLALGVPMRDATGGYRAYRAQVLDALPLGGVASQGYCFQVDLVWQAWRAGFVVAEVPITFVERAAGQSKMSQSIVFEALWRVAWWGVRTGRRGPQRSATSPARAAIPAPASSSAAPVEHVPAVPQPAQPNTDR